MKTTDELMAELEMAEAAWVELEAVDTDGLSDVELLAHVAAVQAADLRVCRAANEVAWARV